MFVLIYNKYKCFYGKTEGGGQQTREDLRFARTSEFQDLRAPGSHVLCSTSDQSLAPSAETQSLLLLVLPTVHLRQTWGPRVHKKCPGRSSAPSTKPRIL